MQECKDRKRIERTLLFGAVGLLGCLLGALIAELYLLLFEPAPREPGATGNLKLVLLIDISGSMKGNRLAEVKNAVCDGVLPQLQPEDNLGIVAFSGSDEKVLDLGSYPLETVKQTVRGLDTRITGTSVSAGLRGAEEMIDRHAYLEGVPCVILFSDGAPTEWKSKSYHLAEMMRKKGIALCAIGAFDADVMYLDKLVGPENVVNAQNGDLLNAFRQAVSHVKDTNNILSKEEMQNIQLPFGKKILFTSGWSAFLTVFTVLFLLGFQNHMLRNSLRKHLIFGAGGGAVVGFVSGVISETIFQFSLRYIYTIADFCFGIGMWACILSVACCVVAAHSRNSQWKCGVGCGVLLASIAVMFFFRSNGLFIVIAPELFRMIAWTIWGWLITNAIGVKFPNFDRKNARWAGAVGGAMGCIGFLICAYVTGDVSGRLLGACCLGGVIGVLVGLLAYPETIIVRDQKTGKRIEVPYGKEPVTIMEGAVTLSTNAAGQTVLKDQNGNEVLVKKETEVEVCGGLLSVDDESAEEREQENSREEDRDSSPHKEEKTEDTGSKPAQAMKLNGYTGKILLLECPQESASDAEVLQKYLGMRPKEVYSIYEKEIILCACKQYPDVFEIQYKPHGLFRRGKKYLVMTRPEKAPELSMIGQILIWNAQKRMQLNAPEAQIPATLLVSCPKELEQSYLQSHPTDEGKAKRNKMMCDWLLDRAGIQKQSWDNVSLCEPKTICSVIEQCIRNLEA